MTPRITRQTKILLQQQETDNYLSKTSFSLAPDPAFNVSTIIYSLIISIEKGKQNMIFCRSLQNLGFGRKPKVGKTRHNKTGTQTKF